MRLVDQLNFTVLAEKVEDRRELFKNHRVLYVYHDAIDAMGDKPGTERRVFEAVDQALNDLVDLVKKAANANATNIFVTADHGFLFQDEALPEHFFLSEKPQGDEILVTNKRYVLGRGMRVDLAFNTFSGIQIELDGDMEVQIRSRSIGFDWLAAVRGSFMEVRRSKRLSCRCSRSTRSARVTSGL